MKIQALLLIILGLSTAGWAGCQLEAKENAENIRVVTPQDLTGKWLQINNQKAYDQEGYIFKPGGLVEDINHFSYQAEKWAVSGDTLKLTIRTNVNKDAPMTVVYKAGMVNDQLILSSFDPGVNYQEVYIKTEQSN